MKKYIILVFFLLAGIEIMNAQNNYIRGYIITNENDTLRGWIDYRTDRINSTVCNFKKDSVDIDATSYVPGQIAGYRFSDVGKYYVSRSIHINGAINIVFLEYLLQGIMNLYYFPYDKNGLSYYILEDQDGKMSYITKRPDKVIEEGGSLYQKKDTKYRKQLEYIFREYEPVKEMTEKADFTHQSIISLTKNYHNLVCKTGEECIEFETIPDTHYRKVKFSVYAGGGYHFFERYGYNRNKLFPAAGCQIDFSIPRWEKSLSLQVSFNLSKIEEKYPAENVNYSYSAWNLGGNIGGKYIHHQGRVRPSVEAGIHILSLLLDESEYRPSENTEGMHETYNSYNFSNCNYFFMGLGSYFLLGNDHFVFVKLIYEMPWKHIDYNTLQMQLGYTF